MKKAAIVVATGLGGFIVYSVTCSWFLDFFRII
jgi:hypothetical protein